MDYITYEKLAVLAIILLILTVGTCWIHTDYRIAKAIEQGNDPVLSRFAFSSSRDESARLLYIIKEEE